MTGTYKIAYLRLIHHGDWTEKTSKFEGLSFGVIGNLCNIDGMNYEFMYCQGNSDAYSKFKWENRTIIFTEIVAKKGKNYRELILTGKYENSIREIFQTMQVIVLNVSIKKGEEMYTLMIRDKDKDTIEEKLQKISSLIEFSMSPRGSIYRSGQTVTQLQRNIMMYAINNGYFDTPREIDLSDLAKAFGMNKTSTNYNLKKALRETLKGNASMFY